MHRVGACWLARPQAKEKAERERAAAALAAAAGTIDFAAEDRLVLSKVRVRLWLGLWLWLWLWLCSSVPTVLAVAVAIMCDCAWCVMRLQVAELGRRGPWTDNEFGTRASFGGKLTPVTRGKPWEWVRPSKFGQ